MRLLLDTQLALWAVTGNPRLGSNARRLIGAAEEAIVVSVVSIWEIAIKYPLQRGSSNDMPIPGREAREQFQAAGFDILPVTAAHAAAVDDLPALHGDPFDRMLVAQALSEPLHLLTRDARLAAYSELVMLA